MHVWESCNTQLSNGKQWGWLSCVVDGLMSEVNTWEIKDSVFMPASWENWSFLTCFD